MQKYKKQLTAVWNDFLFDFQGLDFCASAKHLRQSGS